MPPITVTSALSELLGNDELLMSGEGESDDSGSDSNPSEDNLEADELGQYVPLP